MSMSDTAEYWWREPKMPYSGKQFKHNPNHKGRLIKKLKFKRSWEQEKKLLEKIQKIKSLAEKINKSL